MSFSSLDWDIFISSFQKFHDHPVIFHLERLLRCETVKIWKIHWKLKYLESQYCYANISAKKYRIFIKICMGVNYYLVNLNFKFQGYPFTNAHAQVVNVHTRDKMCARVFAAHARAFIAKSAWNLKLNLTR